MPIEGCLLIDLYPVAGRANPVTIRTSRPLLAAQILPLALPHIVHSFDPCMVCTVR
jgi:Ni,Fe-hydrogenase I large subunit